MDRYTLGRDCVSGDGIPEKDIPKQTGVMRGLALLFAFFGIGYVVMRPNSGVRR